MYDFIYTAALLQAVCLLGGVAVLLAGLWLQRAGGMRRAAACRALGRNVEGYVQGTSAALPEHVTATAQGRRVLLDQLLKEGGEENRKRIAGLDLERLMRAGLRHRRSRIRAMVQMRQAGLSGTAEALEPYWSSKDPDECYFSIYCSIPSLKDEGQKERMSRAVMAASFRGDRKMEMLQALGLSNGFLQDQAEQSGGTGRADLLRSLDGAALTDGELERLLQLLEADPSMRYAAIPCLITSPLRQAAVYLRQAALHDGDPAMRELIAKRLAGQPGEQACQLLYTMMEDPVRAVRESAANSMAAQAEAGKAYLEQAAAGETSLRQGLARRYLAFGGS